MWSTHASKTDADDVISTLCVKEVRWEKRCVEGSWYWNQSSLKLSGINFRESIVKKWRSSLAHPLSFTTCFYLYAFFLLSLFLSCCKHPPPLPPHHHLPLIFSRSNIVDKYLETALRGTRYDLRSGTCHMILWWRPARSKSKVYEAVPPLTSTSSSTAHSSMGQSEVSCTVLRVYGHS